MNIIKKERLGAGCLLSRPDVFKTRAALLDEGEIGHIQLMMIPMDTTDFQQAIELFEPFKGKIRIHAPHHKQQVNPCDPALFPVGTENETKKYIEQAMNQTFEAADRTGSDIIVLHAGGYQPGNKEEAIRTFHEFLDIYPDDRYILESLPFMDDGPLFLGITPDELRILEKGRIMRYCADFPHLWCSALTFKLPYENILSDISTLPLKFSHLSGTPGPQDDRQHLLFDDPDNRFSLELIKTFLMENPNLEVSLEFPHDDPAIIKSQIQIIASL